MQVLQFIFILAEVLLLFNLLIFVHELGHFLAARWRGLKVERFAIWFGKPIWQKEINGVVYCLGSIPAGGYVALPQMAAMDTIEGGTANKQEELPPISVMDKIIVAFAGPLFSVGLALCFAVLVSFVGRPVSETELTTTIGYVFPESPAEEAGLRAGDKILEVDGLPVDRFGGIGDTVTWRIVRSEGAEVPVKILRDGVKMTMITRPRKPETKAYERASLRQIQILPEQTAIIAAVTPNSPAALAGLREGDVVTAVNGTRIHSPAAVAGETRSNPGTPVVFEIRRGTESFEAEMLPVMPEGWAESEAVPEDEKHPMVGIAWDGAGEMKLSYPTPFAQMRASFNAMASTISAVFSRKSEIGFQHLSGPVGIVNIYYRLFQSEEGWRLALWFSVVLNVNLGLLNLLPIPVLDGGHITLALIEGIRRRPVNVRLIGYVQSGCAIIIIGYMLFVTFFDVQDVGRPWNRGDKKPEIRFKAPVSPPATTVDQ